MANLLVKLFPGARALVFKMVPLLQMMDNLTNQHPKVRRQCGSSRDFLRATLSFPYK